MIKTIFKYPLLCAENQRVELPEGAEILTVQAQGGVPCLWAKVDPNAEKAFLTIYMYGTGHPIADSDIEYISTVQLMEGSLVFHFFKLKEIL